MAVTSLSKGTAGINICMRPYERDKAQLAMAELGKWQSA